MCLTLFFHHKQIVAIITIVALFYSPIFTLTQIQHSPFFSFIVDFSLCTLHFSLKIRNFAR